MACMEVAPSAPQLSPEELGSEEEGGLFSSSPLSATYTATLKEEGGLFEDDGGLFSSSDEGGDCPRTLFGTAGIASSTNSCKAADLEGSLWELEDACNESLGTACLGALLISAEVRPEDSSCSSHVLILDLQTRSLAQAGLGADEICEAINSKLSRIKASSASHGISNGSVQVIKLQTFVATAEVEPGSLRRLLQRVMEHLVDLPICANGGHLEPTRKRLRQTNRTDSDEREAFLDELCRERAEAHRKTFEEQQAFRERIIKNVEFRRASALEEVKQVQKHAAAARVLTSRDRWLMGQRPQLDLGLLPWARMVSEQWWALPEAQRQVFRAEAQQDRLWLERLSHTRELQDYVEELDVFLRNLAPTQCGPEGCREDGQHA